MSAREQLKQKNDRSLASDLQIDLFLESLASEFHDRMAAWGMRRFLLIGHGLWM